jgi:2-keto-3-deoxy-L-rhamnonate aldolase RhmA
MLGTNAVKEKLKKGEVCLDAMCQFYAPGFVEFIGRCGCDAITFDSEHGSLDFGQIEDMARACELAGVVPFCRVPAGRPEIILRTMDAGVMGIMVPHVQTREEAEAIVSYVKYPPMGHRGCAATVRAAGYLGMGAKEYVTKANSETMVSIQIEDPVGVQNIESIVKTEGVDCVTIGPNDLSLSMGYPGQVDAPEVQEAIEKIVSTTLNAGLTLWVGADERTGPQWIKRGARLLSINIVPFFRRKWTELVAGLRESGAS